MFLKKKTLINLNIFLFWKYLLIKGLKDKCVCDVGCGTGLTTLTAILLGKSIEAVQKVYTIVIFIVIVINNTKNVIAIKKMIKIILIIIHI